MFDRSKLNMQKRYQQQFDARDSKGARGQEALDWAKLVGTAPKFFKPDVNNTENKINILPYTIASANHPEVVAGRAQVGDPDYVLDIWVHRNLGPDKVTLLCPKKTYGHSCPCCDEVSRLYAEHQDAAAKVLQASRRVYYNVQPYGRNGFEQVSQVFGVSHYLFGKELMEEANACLKGKGVVPFANLSDGKVVAFRPVETAGKGGKMTEFKSFKFLDREEEITDAVLSQCISFDALLTVPTVKELEDAMYGSGDSGENDPQDQSGEQEAEQMAPAISASGSVPVNREEALVNRQAVPPTSAIPAKEEAPIQVDFEPPIPRHSRPPETPVATRGETNPCPRGYTWGRDCDQQPGCARCPDAVYDQCHAAIKK